MKYRSIILFICTLFFTSSIAHAATAYVVVGQERIEENNSFVAEWYLDTQGVSFNVVRGTLYYSSKTLSVQDISTGSSAFTLWPETPQVASPGVLSFIAAAPGGISGNRILLFRTTMRADAAGDASIAIGAPSEVLENNGAGTPLPLLMTPVSFAIVPEQDSTVEITSTTHPDQNIWYQTTEALITIQTPSAEGYVYSFGTNLEIVPSTPITSSAQTFSFTDITDGIYYFKIGLLKQERVQEIATYRVLVDTTPPEFLATSIEKEQSLFGGKPFLTFYATDKASGVLNTRVRVGWFGFSHEAQSPYRISKPLFGNVVELRTSDKAGNVQKTKLYYRGYVPNSISTIFLIILSGIIFRVSYIVWVRFFLKK